jgi:hypothetical protein
MGRGVGIKKSWPQYRFSTPVTRLSFYFRHAAHRSALGATSTSNVLKTNPLGYEVMIEL